MLKFVRKFVLTSGSLKEIPKEYGVSYPTIRLRLDKLISIISENLIPLLSGILDLLAAELFLQLCTETSLLFLRSFVSDVL